MSYSSRGSPSSLDLEARDGGRRANPTEVVDVGVDLSGPIDFEEQAPALEGRQVTRS
jgi:hypothetical protein